jgi:hypothetical protein
MEMRAMWWFEGPDGVPRPIKAEIGTHAWIESMYYQESTWSKRWQVVTEIPCPGAVRHVVDFRNEDEPNIISVEVDHLTVSTVFLPLNHAFWPTARPILYETMVFGVPSEWNEWQTRSHDRWEALLEHTLALRYAHEVADVLIQTKAILDEAAKPSTT